ncbi:MAG TPA: ATP-binding protein [Gammaproteobacteria bacterium]|nr:ATP-binding protein [Gammaproteobacteria bacterium]
MTRFDNAAGAPANEAAFEEERKASEARLKAQLRYTTSLREIATRLVTEESLPAIYDDILSTAVAIMESDAGTVQVYDPRTDSLALLVAQGIPPDMADYFQRVDAASNTACGIALRTGQPSFVDFDKNEIDEACRMHVEAGYRSGQATPLLARDGSRIGMLNTHWRASGHRPSEDQLRFLDLLARQSADLIERRRAEGSLRKSEEKFRTLFETIDEGFAVQELVFDNEGRVADIIYREANAAFEQHTGLAEANGKRASDLFPHIEQGWFDALKRVHQTGVPERTEDYNADTQRWLTAHYSRVGGAGSPLIAAVFNDITERKRAENILRESEERQAFLLKLSDALRALPDEQSIKDQIVKMLAQHLHLDRCWISEVSEQQGISTVGPEHIRPDLSPMSGEFRLSDYPETMRQFMTQPMTIQDAANDPRFSDAEKELFAGLHLRALLVVPLRKPQRHVVWALAATMATSRQWTDSERMLLEDVAERAWAAVERAHVETTLRDSEARLQQASRAKDEFLAMLGHELRNPLQPIRTTLELMRLRQPDALTGERAIIESQIQHMTGMVDDLLDVSRIARGKVELDKKPFDLGDIVARAIETARPLLEECEQTVETAVAENLLVNGDRRRLVQIVTNLLTNAAKYSPPQRTVYVSAAVEGGEAVLRVRDQGIGIDRDLLPRIFESFTQDAQSIERSQGDLGLGLSIVHNLVRMHGGSIDANSEGRDRGSEFIIRLPLLKEHGPETDAPPARPRTAPAPGGKKLKVLIVDDYVGAADSLAALLEAEGFDTRVAHDGAEGLKAAAEFKPAVALVDIGLPVMNGYKVARQLRETPGLASIRLIAVTGYGQDSDRQRATKAGFDKHVVKPFDPLAVAQVVRELAAESAQVSPLSQ